MSKAVFLDRDGVLVRDTGYVHRVDELELLPGVVAGLRRFEEAGFQLIIVTNQSGIARGFYTEVDYEQFTAELRTKLGQAGVTLTAVYHCPHLHDAAVERYAVACGCRKPEPGMLLQAMAAHGIDASASVMIGDRRSDMQAGRAAGVGLCVLIVPHPQQAALPPEADQASADLEACAQFVLTHTTA